MIVFVVDDEWPVMQLCLTVLEMQGYTVEGFTRGGDLLARLASAAEGRTVAPEGRAAAPDLLVVDYKMPGQGGVDVVRRARSLMPGVRVLMITGHGGQDVLDEARAAGVNAVLLKPFAPAELARTVAATLASSAATPRPA